jgi:hypothetical protein
LQESQKHFCFGCGLGFDNPALRHLDVLSPMLRLARPVLQRLLPPGRFKPANVSLRSSIGPSTQRPIDRPSFLLFVRAVLPESPQSPVWAGSRSWWSDSHKKLLQSPPSLCRMVVCVLSDSPRHHDGSGRDWPDKSPSVYRRFRPAISAPVGSRATRKEPIRTAIDRSGIRALSECPTTQDLRSVGKYFGVTRG